MRRLITIILSVAVLVFGWLGWLVANPPVDADPSADAIFVHAGGRGERVRAGIELLDGGAAPTLVVSNPGVRSSQVPRGLCGSDDRIICVTPPTIDTAGEARALGEIVEREGWSNVIVVTSDYHLRRAAVLDSSCTDAEVEAVAARTGRSRSPVTDVRVRETIGLAYGWLFQRCP